MPSDHFLLLWLLAFIFLIAFAFLRIRFRAGEQARSPLRLSMTVPLAAGLGMICFSLCSLISDVILSPSASVLDGLQHLRPQSPTKLERLAGNLERALIVEETPASWSALGMVLALQAEAARGPDRSSLGDNAINALRSSLSIAPANPYVWTRLALMREAAGAEGSEIMLDLRMSWRTGPNEDRLRLTRIGLALRHWMDVAPSDSAAAFEDIRNSWASKPEGLLSLVRSNADANVVRAALVPNLGQLAAFERAAPQVER